MSNCPLAHFALGQKMPVRERPTASVRFIISLGARDGQVALIMRQEGTEQDYIAIREDTLVEIVLEGEQLFFSKHYDAITMKGANLEAFYGVLHYDDYDPCFDRYKSVHFAARYNKGGKIGTRHGFNVNVDLLQYVGGKNHWIGLSIDPDITNPPPHLD